MLNFPTLFSRRILCKRDPECILFAFSESGNKGNCTQVRNSLKLSMGKAAPLIVHTNRNDRFEPCKSNISAYDVYKQFV